MLLRRALGRFVSGTAAVCRRQELPAVALIRNVQWSAMPAGSSAATTFVQLRSRSSSSSPPIENRKIAFVGSYTGFKPGQLGWVGTPNAGAGISAFGFDPKTGKLSDLFKVTAQDSPTWLEVRSTYNSYCISSAVQPYHKKKLL